MLALLMNFDGHYIFFFQWAFSMFNTTNMVSPYFTSKKSTKDLNPDISESQNFILVERLLELKQILSKNPVLHINNFLIDLTFFLQEIHQGVQSSRRCSKRATSIILLIRGHFNYPCSSQD